MNDLRDALQVIADQIAVTRDLVNSLQVAAGSPAQVKGLNLIHLSLIAAQHAVATAIATARRI